MFKNKTLIGAAAISLAAILWGFDGVVLTPRLYNLDVAFVVFLLHLIPFALMNTFLFKEYGKLKSFSREDLITFLLIAFFGGSLGTLAIVKALFLVEFNHLSIVVLLQKLQPIFAIILAAVILKEKLGKNFFLWAAVAIIASYFLTFGFNLPHVEKDQKLVQAAVWAIVAAFSFGSSTVFSKKALMKYTFYTTNFFRFGFATLIMLIYIIIIHKLNHFGVVTSQNWLYFLIIALTTGSGAIFLYYFGLNRVRAMISTICELFFPISAIIFDYIVNKHGLSIVQWLSAAIMITAILKISLNKKLVR